MHLNITHWATQLLTHKPSPGLLKLDSLNTPLAQENFTGFPGVQEFAVSAQGLRSLPCKHEDLRADAWYPPKG